MWTVCEPNVSAWGRAKDGGRTKGEHEGMGRASGEHMWWSGASVVIFGGGVA